MPVKRELTASFSRCTIEVSARSPVSRATGLLGVFRQIFKRNTDFTELVAGSASW